MKAWSKLWTWSGTFSAGLCLLMWLAAIGADNDTGVSLPLNPTKLTGSHEANAIITLAIVGILLHVTAFAWRGYQRKSAGQSAIPPFSFQGIDPASLRDRRLASLWRTCSIVVCLVLPVAGSLWLMHFVVVAAVFEDGQRSTLSALDYMLRVDWGGGNRLRIGNDKGGEFFPALTDLVFVVIVLAWIHLWLPASRSIRRH